MGRWTRDPAGSPVYVADADGERFDYAQLLAGLVENRRRNIATVPAIQAHSDDLSDSLAAFLAEHLSDIDPEIVCRVGLTLISSAGALLVEGVPPALFMNITAGAVAKHAGHIPPGCRVR